MTFTPGPWRNDGRLIYAPGEQGAMICELSEPRASTFVEHTPLRLGSPNADEAYANARLIAAAPDLLHALHLADEFLRESDLSPEVVTLTRHIRAAIAKAEGREPAQGTGTAH